MTTSINASSTAGATQRSTYAVLGHRALVTSNSSELIDCLDDLNQAFTAPPTASPAVAYEAYSFAEQGLWEVTVDGEELEWCSTMLGAAGVIEWHLVNQAIERRHDLLHLHAALLAGPAASLLLPGGSGIGKTTLALALTLHGLRLYADDVVLLQPQTGQPLPFPRALHVHDDALARLTTLGLRYDPTHHVGPYLSPAALAPWPVTPGPRLGFIILLGHPQPDRALALEPITQAEAAVEMLRVSKNLDAFPRRGLELLPSLLAGVACYRLQRNDDIAAAAALLTQLVVTGQAPAPIAPGH